MHYSSRETGRNEDGGNNESCTIQHDVFCPPHSPDRTPILFCHPLGEGRCGILRRDQQGQGSAHSVRRRRCGVENRSRRGMGSGTGIHDPHRWIHHRYRSGRVCRDRDRSRTIRENAREYRNFPLRGKRPFGHLSLHVRRSLRERPRETHEEDRVRPGVHEERELLRGGGLQNRR